MPTSPTPHDPTTQDEASVAVGGRTSGQQGATVTHESQQETGGNGGPGLSRNQAGPYVNAPDGAREGDPTINAANEGASVEALDSQPRGESVDAAMTHANPGAQDTRASQAGARETGLGTPETGASQSENDLPPLKP